MSRQDTTAPQLLMNIAPVTFENRVNRVGLLPFLQSENGAPSTQLAELRQTHTGSHIFLRRGSKILCVGTVADAAMIGEETAEVSLNDDLGLCAALVREALISYLHNLRRPVLNFDPIEFLAVGKEDDLLATSAPNGMSCPDWLSIRLRYEVSVRILRPEANQPLIGLSLNVGTTNIITVSCKQLLDLGLSVDGLYVQRLEFYQDTRLEPRRCLVGRVAGISNDVLTLEDSAEGWTSIPAGDAYLEPRRENFERCVRHVFGDGAPRLLAVADAKRAELRSGPGRLTRIRAVFTHLRRLSLEMLPGLVFSIGEPWSQAGKESFFPRILFAPKPVYVFDAKGPRTSSWHDAGLDDHGPYDQVVFTPKRPRVAVICQAEKRGQVEQFIHKLLQGMPGVKSKKGRAPFGKGLLRKYGLDEWEIEFIQTKTSAARAYEQASNEAIEKAADTSRKWDLTLVQTEDRFHQLHGEDNPYLVSKAAFLKRGIPSQEVEIETMSLPDKQLVYVLNNLGLACYAKLGGIPWLLQANPAIAHELVFGLGSANVGEGRLGSRERVVGITTVFTGDGNYVLENRSRAVAFADYPETLLACLRQTIQTVKTAYNWQPRSAVRLVFHAFKPFRNVETEVVKKAVEALGDYEVEYAFVHIVKDHPYILFDEMQPGVMDFETRRLKGKLAPFRGLYLKLGDREVLMCLTGAREVKRPEDGMPAPLLLRLHKGSTFVDTTYLARQAYAFSCHSWRTFFPSPLPVTVMYSELIARLLGSLSKLPRWDPDAMLGPIGRTRWFL